MPRTKLYTIAQFLPMRLKRKMAAQTYNAPTVDEFGDAIFEGISVCKTGRCPLGWLFADPPSGGKLRLSLRLPDGNTIARRIKQLSPSLAKDVDVFTLSDYATDFTDDWDEGKIKNLAAALGVSK